jgi:O-antigen/teichoic acid export membrane protein
VSSAEKQPPTRASLGHALTFGGFSFLGGALIAVATSFLTARIYGIDAIGKFALLSAPTGVVGALSTISEQPALIKRLAVMLPRAPEATGLFAAVLIFSTTLTVVVALLTLAVCYPLFRGPWAQPSLYLPAAVSLAGYVLLTNPCWNLDTVFVAYRSARQLFWIRTIQVLVNLILAVALSYWLRSYWGLVIALNASWLFALLHRLVAVRRWIEWRVPRGSFTEGLSALPDMLRFGAKISPSYFVDGINAQVGTWTLGVLASISVVGAYSRAWSLARRFLDLQNRVAEMLLAALVERHARGDRAGFERALVDSMRYTAGALLLPAAVGGGAAAGIMRLYGPGFGTAASALAILLVVPVLMALTGTQVQALIALDRPLSIGVAAIVGLIVTLSATVALAILMGLSGAAIGFVVGTAVQTSIQWITTRSHLTCRVRDLWTVRQFAGLAFAYATSFGTARVVYQAVGGPIGLASALGAGSLVYVATLVLVGGLAPRDRSRASAVVRRLRPQLA